jgi:HD-GYP domain
MSLLNNQQDAARAEAPRSSSKRQIVQHDGQGADERRQVMLCYARAAAFLSQYFKTADLADPPASSGIRRVMQELVDLGAGQPSILLSLTIMHGEGENYLVFHHVNTALMAIALGHELGLSRTQLLSLSLCALFHETGESRLPREFLEAQGALSDEAKAALDQVPLGTLQQILNEKQVTTEHLRRIQLCFDLHEDHCIPDRDEKGALKGLVRGEPRSGWAEIISICSVYDALRTKRPYRSAYKPEAALLLMWSELRHRFDADLLRVFMRVILIPPFKLRGRQSKNILLEDPPASPGTLT